VIDEGWTYSYGDVRGRDTNGFIVPDPSRFPDMAALVGGIHSKGLLAGIYSEDGARTAAGYIGSLGHFEQDAATFAQWGFDFVKFDIYRADYPGALQEFAGALDATDRPIFLYSGINGPSHGGPDAQVLQTANAYRFIGDVGCSYPRFTNLLFYGSSVRSSVSSNHFVDYDTMLWNDGTRASLPALRTSLGMLSMLSAPLMIPAFLSPRDFPGYFMTLTNAEAIAIDQDPAVVPATCVQTNGPLLLWVKPLGPPSSDIKAVAWMNLDTTAAHSAWIEWSTIGLPPGTALVRDIWAGQSAVATNSYLVTVGPGDLALLKISSIIPIETHVLTVRVDAGNLVLSWLGTNAFELLSTPTLESPDWHSVTEPVQSVSGSNWVTISPLQGQQFFRLAR
jgi:alpha-galactosidase